jgi:hypothetical protein
MAPGISCFAFLSMSSTIDALLSNTFLNFIKSICIFICIDSTKQNPCLSHILLLLFWVDALLIKHYFWV